MGSLIIGIIVFIVWFAALLTVLTDSENPDCYTCQFYDSCQSEKNKLCSDYRPRD